MPRGSATAKSAVTMQDIADRVGVSKALVSMIFRGVSGPSAETRERVMAVAAELDYRPNRSAAMLALHRTRLIGVVANIRNAFHAEVVEYLVEEAAAVGYEIVLGAVTPTHGESTVFTTLLDFRCEAIVMLGPEAARDVLVEWNEKVPVLAVGRRVSGVDVVRTADSRGMSAVVDHLVSLGHRRITHLSGGPGPIAQDRRDGYVRALRRHGLGDAIDVIDGDFTEQSGIDAAATIIGRERDRPTAVVAANDRSAVGILGALRRARIDVPGDISVTGYDDSALAQMVNIDLTTVSQEPRDQAVRAISAVLEQLDGGRTDTDSTVLRPRLVVRSTTASCRH